MEENINEIWRKVSGFDEYEVSNLGRVRRKNNNTGYRYLSGYKNPDGFIIIQLNCKGRVSRRILSRMVAEAFVPNENNGWNVRHKDGDISNNKAENLCWIVPKKERKYDF